MGGTEPIRPVVVKGKDGKKPVTRYRLVVDIGKDPVTGKRKQLTRTFDRKKDAKDELARIRNERNTGTYVAPRKTTVSDYLDSWLAGHVRDLESATARNYRDALAPVRERLGARELQSIEKADFDALAEWMAAAGRKRGGKVGTGLGPRSIIMTLNTAQMALDVAVAERKLSYNPVRLVKRPKRGKPVHKLWTDAEEARFFDFAERDRLAAVIELFARGLRPEELCGIRWSDIPLDQKVAAVGKNVRTMVEGKPVEKGAKTEAGIRTLPLDDDLAARLKRWHAQQSAEKLAAGEAYVDGGYVLTDELGTPWLPDKLRRYMYALMKQASVTKVTPYEAMRHAAGSRMARSGVPGHVIAAWLGHTKASFTYDNYVHARPDDLAVARDALGRKSG